MMLEFPVTANTINTGASVAQTNDTVMADESFSTHVNAVNSDTVHAHKGVVILRNGPDSQLSQATTFFDTGPVTLSF
jgi:hypothetical protein